MNAPSAKCDRTEHHAGGRLGAAGGLPKHTEPRIIISNGFDRFPLRTAALEAERRGALAGFITGGYPTPGVARCIRAAGLARIGAMGRLLARAVPLVPTRVHALWAGEPLQHLASRLRRASRVATYAADHLDLAARRLYAAAAAPLVAKLARAECRGIYHYRSGFGGASIDVARRHGWRCLCEHSIAHPAVLHHLVAHSGRLPANGASGPIARHWSAVLADIERADHVLANSEFVKSTFFHQGWRNDRISVIYRGIDDEFLSAVPARVPNRGPMRVLFAGIFSRRKGGPVARRGDGDASATAQWRLDLCGSVDAGGGRTVREVHSATTASRTLASCPCLTSPLAWWQPTSSCSRRWWRDRHVCCSKGSPPAATW